MSIDWAAIQANALREFTLAVLPPTLSLPALPLAVTQFVERASNPDVQMKHLTEILETDTGLTLELLKHVNSAFVGLRSKAGSVMQALSLLGISKTKNLMITVGARAAVQARQSKLINQSCFWNATLQKALFARELAFLLNTDTECAFAGALLQDFLLPVLTNELYGEYTRFIETRDQHSQNLWEFEQQNFGWDHALAGACLAHQWGLPDDLVCCILFQHQGLKILSHPELKRTPVAAVALSGLLPDQLRQCFQGLEQLILLQEQWPEFNLQQMAEIVDAKHAEIGLGVRNDFPLARRCRSVLTQSADNVDGSLIVAA